MNSNITTEDLSKKIAELEERIKKPEFLLNNPSHDRTGCEMTDNGEKLRRTLLSFGVEATMDNICTGPVITRYEIIPGQGTRFSDIAKLDLDIALAFSVPSVRIEAPVPGKSAIGIEIPNDTIQNIYFSEIIKAEEFKDFNSKTAFAIGRDIAGNDVVYDIAKAPHMLIAGSLGSGKVVCIYTLIASILLKATPDEVRFIMIDTKIIELSFCNGIPHLLIPVVTDPKKAVGALNWAVSEMMRRYALLSATGTRNLQSYNALVEVTEKLPQIVIIISELADLMVTHKRDAEDAICRIAQLAHAVGIHLIIATQRPSAGVITGLIKANISTRIAFKVSSAIDSRTILDKAGAEKLIGRGDMLFRAADMNNPSRIHGAFIFDEEITDLVNSVKSDAPDYDQTVLEYIEKNANK